MLIANTKGRVSTLAVDDNLDMHGRNVTNADVVSVNEHVTLVGARVPGKGFRHVERDGWYVSKDNNDIERKFWKDDFSVDSSDQYTGHDGTSKGFYTWDTANSKLVWQVTSITANQANIYNPITAGQYGISSVSFKCTVPNESYKQRIGLIVAKRGDVYVGAAIRRRTNGTNRFAIFMGSWEVRNSTGLSIAVDFFDGATYTITVETTPTGISGKIYREGVYVNGYTVPYAEFTKFTPPTPDEFVIGFGSQIEFAKNITCEIYDLSFKPTISYADDFSTDTTERYQPVLGTVAYDDANKRMNVTTASEVNGKASGRLKSYKFCEGSQIYDVLLPTGADGDFICMVTHATDPAMTSGIGVGLQSDGAGNWNLATLSGTTVTVGASSGLTDGKTARIEIEKDLSGAYWYYIYDASGTKPTTATGKLFTTLTEGYTGWYANGAGATTQTYAIDNISIRAESIVGRTNVEVTEDVFNSVTGEMESRTYFKPIHRGAMLESYHDGTQEVVGTTFIDDCQWDRSAEYTSLRGAWTHDVVSGYIQCTKTSSYGNGYLINGVDFDTVLIQFEVLEYRETTNYGTWGIVLASDGILNSTNYFTPYNGLLVTPIYSGGIYKNGALIQPLALIPATPETWVKVKIFYDKLSNRLKIYVDGMLIQSEIIPESMPYGKILLYAYIIAPDVKIRFRNITIIGITKDSPNGIAACIPPIGGGARYGVEEEVYFDIDNGVRYNESVVLATVKTLNPANEGVEMFFGNTTDSSKITTDDTDVEVISLENTNYKDVVKDIVLNYDDRGDEIKVGVRKTGDNVATVYVETLAVVPKVEVV